MKKLRIYVDTSVFGGCFDEEFAEASQRLIEGIKAGKFSLVLSATTLRELARAPNSVRQLVAELPQDRIEIIGISDEIEKLRDAYVREGVVGASSRLDAEHIASASVAGADVVVSWNYKHLVNLEKIRGYQAVNLREGYHPLPIYTPREVIGP